ncbi:MarR family winged helix-turn-helix transcriptional regulator [Nocardia nova]|uniref:MarR family winged helix-turn-helix transcriptional regulator n=1 Tax=Nocardia nova TaxID=37330 RepID=UPI0033C1BF72
MDSVARDIDTWMAQMPAADRDVEELRQRVGRLSRLFDRLLDQVAAAREISRADWTALSVIIRGDGCTPTELARELGLTSGTVSTRIKRLSEAGLIAGDSGAVDARSRPVCVTPAGHELWASATADRTRRETALIRAVFDDADLAAVNARLARLLAALEDDLGLGPKHDVPPAAR